MSKTKEKQDVAFNFRVMANDADGIERRVSTLTGLRAIAQTHVDKHPQSAAKDTVYDINRVLYEGTGKPATAKSAAKKPAAKKAATKKATSKKK